MDAPDYRWVCHKCQTANQAGTGACVACGMSAHARASQFAPPEEPGQVSQALRATMAPSTPVLRAVPDLQVMAWMAALFAAYAALISPIWFLLLVMRGQMAAALVLGAGTAASAFGFVVAVQQKKPALAYTCVAGVIVTSLIAQSLRS